MICGIGPSKITSILGSILGANMGPFSLPKPSQNRSKLDPEGHPKIDAFSHRLPTLFCSILGPKMGPCWGQVGTKNASRAGPGLTLRQPDPFPVALGPLPGGSWTSTAAFRPPEPSKWDPKAPKMDPRPPQNPPKSLYFFDLKRTPGPLPGPLAPGPPSPNPCPGPAEWGGAS